MSPVNSLTRRGALQFGGAALGAGIAPAVFAAARRVRYVLAIPTLSVIVTNQTSIPRLLGYYDQENLAVEPALAGAGGVTAAVQLVSTGDQDIGSGSITPVMSRAAAGQDLGVSFFYLQVRSYVVDIAVPTASPARSLADLKGKLIGVPTLANEGVAMARFAARELRMDPEADLKLIAVGAGPQAGQAIRSGQVAAYVAPRSQISQIESLGITMRSLPPSPRFADLFGPGLFARRDYIRKNRATVVGVGRAVAKSTVFMLNNPEAAIRLHWKAHPEQVPQGAAADKALQDALRVLRVQAEGLRLQENDRNARYGYYRPQSVAAALDVFGWNAVKQPADFFTNDLIEEINAFDAKKIADEARAYRVA